MLGPRQMRRWGVFDDRLLLTRPVVEATHLAGSVL